MKTYQIQYYVYNYMSLNTYILYLKRCYYYGWKHEVLF